MVQLSRETIEKFKEFFKRRYGVEYSDKKAHEAAHNLVGLFDLLLKIDYRQKRERRPNIDLPGA